MMSLSAAVLDAIKNKTYTLKPVERNIRKKESNEDHGIREILSRRMAMGYAEEENWEDQHESLKDSSLFSFK